MKDTTLETLLLDRALGELSPEVAELLDEYLTQNPDAARQAGAVCATAQLAREAVALPRAASVPPLANARWRQAARVQRWRRWRNEALRLAAAVALGLAVGGYGSLTHRTQVTAPPVAIGSAPSTALAGAGRSSPRIWSSAKLQAEQRARTAPAAGLSDSRYRLRWDSPVKMPRVEEKP